MCIRDSDIGKLLDPVCDVSAHFLCLFAFTTLYITPPIVLVIFVLREIWVTFLRALLLRRGIALASRWTGKIKTWAYAIAILLSILILPQGILARIAPEINTTLLVYVSVMYYLAAGLSIISALGYVKVLIKNSTL